MCGGLALPAEPRGRTGPRRRVPSELPRERSRGLTEPGKLPARSSQEHRFLAAMRSVLARRDAPRPVFGPVKQRRDASVISHVNKSLRRAPLLFQRKCRAENGPRTASRPDGRSPAAGSRSAARGERRGRQRAEAAAHPAPLRSGGPRGRRGAAPPGRSAAGAGRARPGSRARRAAFDIPQRGRSSARL